MKIRNILEIIREIATLAGEGSPTIVGIGILILLDIHLNGWMVILLGAGMFVGGAFVEGFVEGYLEELDKSND